MQLFNALKKHQKNVDERMKEVGGSERKKSKILSSVSKKDFIDVLRGADVARASTAKKEKVVRLLYFPHSLSLSSSFFTWHIFLSSSQDEVKMYSVFQCFYCNLKQSNKKKKIRSKT